MHFSSPTFLDFSNGAASCSCTNNFDVGRELFMWFMHCHGVSSYNPAWHDVCSKIFSSHLNLFTISWSAPSMKSSQLSGPALWCQNVCVIQSNYVYFSPFLSAFPLPSETWCIAVQVMDTHNIWCLQPAILSILQGEEDVLEEFKTWKEEEWAYSPTAWHRNPVNVECIWVVFTNGITPSRRRLFIFLPLW